MRTYFKRTYLLTSKFNAYVVNVSYYKKTDISIINFITKNKTYEVSVKGQCLTFNETYIKYSNNNFDISLETNATKPINRRFFLPEGRIKLNNYFRITKGYIKIDDFNINLENFKCLIYTYQGSYVGKYLVNYSYNFNNYGGFMFMTCNMHNKIKLFYISEGRLKTLKLKCKIKTKNDIINVKASSIFSYIRYNLSLEDKVKVLTLKDIFSNNFMDVSFNDKTLIKLEDENLKFTSEILNSINLYSYNL